MLLPISKILLTSFACIKMSLHILTLVMKYFLTFYLVLSVYLLPKIRAPEDFPVLFSYFNPIKLTSFFLSNNFIVFADIICRNTYFICNIIYWNDVHHKESIYPSSSTSIPIPLVLVKYLDINPFSFEFPCSIFVWVSSFSICVYDL